MKAISFAPHQQQQRKIPHSNESEFFFWIENEKRKTNAVQDIVETLLLYLHTDFSISHSMTAYFNFMMISLLHIFRIKWNKTRFFYSIKSLNIMNLMNL